MVDFTKIDKYFLKYKNYCKSIFIKENQLDVLKNTIGSVHASTLSSNNVSSNSSHANNGLECKLIQKEKLEEQLKKLYDRKEKQRTKHINDFKKLSKDEYEIILTCYYLDKTSIKNISIKLDKSIGHIKKMKREALIELVEKVIKKNT